ncbi:MAG: DUF4920 domain-containing protein [Elusimicrobia bacterium]|nr:DUF4920 domain-containing protein [Elusimicrobiota bacterium]
MRSAASAAWGGIMTIAGLLLVSLAAAASEPSNVFGTAPTLSEPVPLADVLAEPARYAKREILLEGTALKVCQKKGCWLVLQEDGKDIRITFKDYGFFIPKASLGKRVRAQGMVEEVTLSPSQVRHFLKDEGAPRAEIRKVKAPVKTAAFVASGLALSGPVNQ